jgi:DNA repair photolyase
VGRDTFPCPCHGRTDDTRWPPAPAREIPDFAGTGFTVFEQMFGALSQDPTSPYSRISVANASFSLDPFAGCPLRCAYCVAGSSARDLMSPSDPHGLIRTRPELLHRGTELVSALVMHPGFLPGRSVVSIGTGSTEPFLPATESETWTIIESLAQLDLRNPIWIVTKTGVPRCILDQWLPRFAEAARCGIPIILSITYSAAPTWMEPDVGDRFDSAADLQRVGVRVAHHYRPIVRGINDTDECLHRALDASLRLAEVICVGGLRPDPGIRLVWEKVHQLDPKLLPTGSKKDLPEAFLGRIEKALVRLGSTTPLVSRSSEAIATLLGIPDYNLYRYQTHEACFLHLPLPVQARVTSAGRGDLATIVRRASRAIQLDDVDIHVDGECLTLNRTLPYQEHHLLLHTLGFSGVFP